MWKLRAPDFITLILSQVAADLLGMGIASWRHKDLADGSQLGLIAWCIVFGIYALFLGVTLTKITLDPQNRMLRAGFGKHDGKWFFRIDLWVAGFRLSR